MRRPRPQEKANFETRRGEVTAIMGGYVTLSLPLRRLARSLDGLLARQLSPSVCGDWGKRGGKLKGGPPLVRPSVRPRPSRDPFARCDFRFHLVDPNRHGTARTNFIWTGPRWTDAGSHLDLEGRGTRTFVLRLRKMIMRTDIISYKTISFLLKTTVP